MITGNFSTDILIIYIPAALAILMGVLGTLRGARREAIVSGSIVLAALIIIVWGVPWATDLSNIFTNFTVSDSRNVLAYIVMGLSVLVIGYMLGSALVPRTPTSPISRLGGLLLGIANGLAIGGYFIRGQYDSAVLNPSGANLDLINTLTSNTIARYLWIWANWFPLAVAIIAAIVALVGPFRRAQTVVATPPARTDWGPNPAPAVGAATIAAPGPAAYTTGYGQAFTGQYPQQPAPQYGQQPPQAPTQPYTYAPAGQQQYAPYPQFGAQPQQSPPAPAHQPSTPPSYASTQYAPSPAPAPAPVSRVEDAPPTTLMPGSDQQRSTPSGGQETLYMGSTPARSPKDTGPLGDHHEWTSANNVPAWLASPQSGQASSPQVDSSLVSRADAPTQAQPIISSTSGTAAMVNCPRCGTANAADATFCTECGNKLKA